MTTARPRRDLSGILYEELYPALWASLDGAFPEFGFRQWGGYWRATNENHTRTLPGNPEPKQVRVYQNRSFGFVIHGADFIPWTTYAKSGEGEGIVDVARRLANRAAVSFPDREFSAEEIKTAEKRERRGRLLECLLVYTWAALNSDKGSAARAYLLARAFTIRQAETLEFGFYTAPGDIIEGLAANGFSAEEIEASGMLSPAWSRRLIGPWRDRTGRIINEWGRRIENEPTGAEARAKWIEQGGPAYLFQGDGSKASPFGLDRIQGRDLVLVEEILDVLALRAAGFDDAISLGGAELEEEQIRALTHARAHRLTINLNFDPTPAPCESHKETFCLRCYPGVKRTHEILDKAAAAPFQVYVVDPSLLANMDDISDPVSPPDYVRREGLDAYTALFDKSTKGPLFRAESVLREHRIDSDQAKDSTVQALLQYDQRIQNESDRKELWRLAAERTGFSYSYLLSLARSRAESRGQEDLSGEFGRLLDDSRRALEEKSTTLEGLVARLADGLEGLKARMRLDEPEPFSTDSLLEKVKEAGEGKLSGWTALDRLGQHFHPSELTVVGSRTGHGKTTFLLSLLLNWLDAYPNETFLFYSYEVPPEAILIKLASALTRKEGGKGWTYYGIRSCLRRYEDYPMSGRKELEDAFNALRAWEDRLVTVYRPVWTVEDLASHARKVADRAGGLGGILVDFIQLVPPPPGDYDRPEVEASAVSRRLKLLAVDLACPVVAAAHISRETIAGLAIPKEGSLKDLPVQEAIKARQPQLHHLRDSGSEQPADLVLGLLNYRADFLQEREILDAEERSKPARLDVVTLKNRYGGLGTGTLVLEAWTNTIRDPERGDEL